jgi:predicted metal-dependent hydrolase
MSILRIEDLNVEVTKKKVKYIYLRICHPNGEVKVSAPRYSSLDSIRVFVLSKLPWIKEQQVKVKNRKREIQLDFVSNEIHYFDGKSYALNIIEKAGRPQIMLKDNVMEMYVKPDTVKSKRKLLVESLYRKHLKDSIPVYVQKWEPVMKVKVNSFNVKRMRTKWGTCNIREKRIWLSLELAKKPAHLLEYVVVHEMVHLLERNHSKRFYGFMNEFLPGWRYMKEELNKVS